MKILAPHKEQDGWRYLRMNHPVGYIDTYPESRTISSRRVEEAVENEDYRKRCEDEGLYVHSGPLYSKDGTTTIWSVSADTRWTNGHGSRGTTLREAYHRFKAAES